MVDEDILDLSSNQINYFNVGFRGIKVSRLRPCFLGTDRLNSFFSVNNNKTR